MTATGTYEFTLIYQPLPDGGYEVNVPSLPEVFAHGDTLEEARENARDMLQFVVESMVVTGETIPQDSVPVVEKMSVSLT